MTSLIFDIETDGLLDAVTQVHCGVTIDLDSGRERLFRPDQIGSMVNQLNAADTIIGHNVVDFDIPVLQKFFEFTPKRVLDTLCASRTAYAGKKLMEIDISKQKRGEWIYIKKVGSHALDAWGERLGLPKLPKPESWASFDEQMLVYNRQDAVLTRALFQFIVPNILTEAVLDTESRCAQVFFAMKEHGVGFNESAATDLMARLIDERALITMRLREAFPAWVAPKGKPRVAKRDMESKKYEPDHPKYRKEVKGETYQAYQTVEFNPASGDHIAKVLMEQGWKPKSFTPGGKPETAEKAIRALPHPSIADLVRFQNVKKTLGMLSEGDNAWLKLVRDGRIHGTTRHVGTVTHRVAHQRPNLGQVPVRSELGKECRGLFTAGPGRVLVGVDASGLQLRVLAHYLARYDNGIFAKAVTEGDIHEHIRLATGLYTRDAQKNMTYGYLFGAGDPKLGLQVVEDLVLAKERGLYAGKIPGTGAHRRLGAEVRQKLVTGIPGLEEISGGLAASARRGYLHSLDGRRVEVLSRHRALNTLLMGGEAVIMKTALLLAMRTLEDRLGGEVRDGWNPVLFVHDEIQFETELECAGTVGEFAVSAVRAAGEKLNMRCELAAQFKVGQTWKETH